LKDEKEATCKEQVGEPFTEMLAKEKGRKTAVLLELKQGKYVNHGEDRKKEWPETRLRVYIGTIPHRLLCNVTYIDIYMHFFFFCCDGVYVVQVGL
jgi:hypothetical protein